MFIGKYRVLIIMFLGATSLQATIEWTISQKKDDDHAVTEDYAVGQVSSINWLWHTLGWQEQGIWAVFDGHRNEQCSQFLSQHIIPAITKDSNYPGSISQALANACRDLDVDFLAKNKQLSGCTGIIAVLNNGKLYVANVGDSRAVMGGLAVTKELSIDHKPNLYTEKDRIESFGGQVDQDTEGTWRVFHDDSRDRGLAMSRAFGDADYKKVGVIVDPEIQIHDVTTQDDVLILASDGLWDVVSSDWAVREAVRYLNAGQSLQQAADHLVGWASGHDSLDDITVIVVDLRSMYGRK